MPIRPSERSKYPADWAEISARIRVREGNRCKWCKAENGQAHPETGSRVVLTVAHLDHDPANNVEENLAALCQRCHLQYDRAQHVANTRETWRSRMAVRDLFDDVDVCRRGGG
jgi:hypothetical protein